MFSAPWTFFRLSSARLRFVCKGAVPIHGRALSSPRIAAACVACNAQNVEAPARTFQTSTGAREARHYLEIFAKRIPCRAMYLSAICAKSKAKKAKKPEVIIRHEDAEEYIDLNSVHQEMKQVVSTMRDEFTRSFRVGADVKLLDQLTVSLEGDNYQLREVARIVKKSPRLLELDFVSFPEALKASEAVIRESELNFNPSVKGTKVEVPIPEVTTEHRKILVKAAKKRMNDTKEELRKVRNHTEKSLGKIEKIPEDLLTAIRKQIHAYLDEQSSAAEETFKAKEKELTLQ